MFFEKLKRDNKFMSDYQILKILNANLRISTFRDIYKVMYKLGPQYDDEKILNLDEEYKKNCEQLLIEVQNFESRVELLQDNFIYIELFRNIRIKEIKPQMIAIKETYDVYIPKMLREYCNDLEKIYSYFFVHPCNLMSILDIIPDNKKKNDFIEGILPLYKSASEKIPYNLITIYFVAFFRRAIYADYYKYTNDLKYLFKYGDENVILPKLINVLLFNSYGKCEILNIFPNSFKHIYEYSSLSNDLNDMKTLNNIYKIINDTYDGNLEVIINLNHIKEIIKFYEFFLAELIQNLKLLPEAFVYCVKYIKRYIRKDQSKFTDDKNKIIFLISNSIIRFFYSNIIGDLLIGIFNKFENSFFICQMLGINKNSGYRILIEMYTKLIGILFKRFACMEYYEYREPNNQDSKDSNNFDDIGITIGKRN